MPEIEKEVKRLLRTDNEAVTVKWEIVECEEPVEPEPPKTTAKGKKSLPVAGKSKQSVISSESLTVDEQHIFGELSDSEEEVTLQDFDAENTRLSAEDSRSRFSDSNSMMQEMQSASNSRMPVDFNKTEFSSSMFDEEDMAAGSSHQHLDDELSNDFLNTRENSRASTIRRELQQLKLNQVKIEAEIQSIDNKKLKERLQENLDHIMGDIIMKEMELQEIEENLQ